MAAYQYGGNRTSPPVISDEQDSGLAMEMRPECVPCLLGRVLFETEEIDGSKSTETVKAAARMLGELFGPGACSATVATKVHEEIYRIIGNDDPYEELKGRSNETMVELFPEAQRFVDSSDDRLQAAFICAVVGNVLDFGIGTDYDSPEPLKDEFRNLLAAGLGWDDTPEIRDRLLQSEDVVYLADNCGEIVLDRLALREISALGARTTLVVKEKPILTDVTMKDLVGLGMDAIADDIIEAPGFAVGIDLDALKEWFGKRLRKADLIIAKGMANYEALSETDIAPIAYLLRTKCSPVADSLGLKRDINAVKLLADGGVR